MRSRAAYPRTRARIAAFKAELERGRVPSTVRLTRGRDIEAACGQLAAAALGRSPRGRNNCLARA